MSLTLVAILTATAGPAAAGADLYVDNDGNGNFIPSPVNLYNNNFDQSEVVLPSRPDLDAQDFIVMNDMVRVDAIAAANELAPVILSDGEVDDLLAFLFALTDKSSIDLRQDVPLAVPSGISLAE